MLFKYILDWFSLPVLTALAVIFIWRRLYKEFPLFFCYIIVTELTVISRFVIATFVHPWYFSLYWISNIIMSVAALMAVYEVFVKRLFAEFYKVRLYRLLFPAVAIMSVILGLFTLSLSHQEWASLAIFDRALSFVRVATLLFFVALMLLMGREWTRYELGVAFGFGALAASSFFSSAMWTRSPRGGQTLPAVIWNIACVIWLVCFGKTKQTGKVPALEPLDPALLREARAWENTLKSWLTSPRKGESATSSAPEPPENHCL